MRIIIVTLLYFEVVNIKVSLCTSKKYQSITLYVEEISKYHSVRRRNIKVSLCTSKKYQSINLYVEEISKYHSVRRRNIKVSLCTSKKYQSITLYVEEISKYHSVRRRNIKVSLCTSKKTLLLKENAKLATELTSFFIDMTSKHLCNIYAYRFISVILNGCFLYQIKIVTK